MKPSEALQKSIDVIDQYGWIQGNLGSDRCGWCAIGAVSRAVGRVLESGHFDYAYVPGLDEEFKKAVKYLVQVVAPKDPFLGIAEWNDTEGRTEDQVLEALVEAQRLAVLAGE